MGIGCYATVGVLSGRSLFLRNGCSCKATEEKSTTYGTGKGDERRGTRDRGQTRDEGRFFRWKMDDRFAGTRDAKDKVERVEMSIGMTKSEIRMTNNSVKRMS